MDTSLEEGDIDRLLEAVGQLTQPGSMRDLRFRCVAALASLVAADHVAWGEIDREDGHIKALMWPEPPDWPALEAAFAANLGDHPVIARYLESGDGRAAAISDFVEPGEFRATGLYREFFQPIGSEDQLCLILPCPPLLVGIGLDRSQPGFSRREREIVDRLAVPLANAYAATTSYERLQRVFLVTARQNVETEGEGLVLVDRFARLEYASPNALDILRRSFHQNNRDGLPIVLEQWIKDGWNTHRNPRGPEWPIAIEQGRDRLVVEQTPGPDGLGACLTIREKRQTVAAQPVHVSLGLSSREGQILALVAAGMTNDGIARALRISPRTVAKHLERILLKLPAPNRTAAAEMLRDAERASPTAT
jgi:DNA-binding CsgD family transcriptional regulator